MLFINSVAVVAVVVVETAIENLVVDVTRENFTRIAATNYRDTCHVFVLVPVNVVYSVKREHWEQRNAGERRRDALSRGAQRLVYSLRE